MSLEERKARKASQKTSTRKKTVSTAATERTNWHQIEQQARPSNKRQSMNLLLNFVLRATELLVRNGPFLLRGGGEWGGGGEGLDNFLVYEICYVTFKLYIFLTSGTWIIQCTF